MATTYATQAILSGRDDDHIIYEEQNISQYEDGSVLDCVQMKAYTAEQVIAGRVFAPVISYSTKYVRDLNRDLLCNAKKAVVTPA